MRSKNRRSSFENPTVLQAQRKVPKIAEAKAWILWASLSISELWAPDAAGRVSWKGTKWIFENSGLATSPCQSHPKFPEISVPSWAAGRVVPIDIDHGVQIHDANLGRDGFSCHHLMSSTNGMTWTTWTIRHQKNGVKTTGIQLIPRYSQLIHLMCLMEYNWCVRLKWRNRWMGTWNSMFWMGNRSCRAKMLVTSLQWPIRIDIVYCINGKYEICNICNTSNLMYKSLGSPVSRCFHHLPSSSSPFQPIPAHSSSPAGSFCSGSRDWCSPGTTLWHPGPSSRAQSPKGTRTAPGKNPWHPVRLGVLNGFTMVYHMTLVDTICHMATWFTMVYYDIDWVDLAHKICWIFRIHLCSEEQDTWEKHVKIELPIWKKCGH